MTLNEAKAEIAKVLGVEAKAVYMERNAVMWVCEKGTWEAWARIQTMSDALNVRVRRANQNRDSILVLLIGAVKGVAKVKLRWCLRCRRGNPPAGSATRRCT